MDLIAFLQIDELKPLYDKLSLNIPRLRGLRDMAEEETVDMANFYPEKQIFESAVRNAICQIKGGFVYDRRTDKLLEKYIVDGVVQWNKIHGRLKQRANKHYGIKLYNARRELAMFNKYVGKDVLQVHARIGNRWAEYRKPIVNHPNFLEWCLDCVDNSYCDIYFKKEK